MQISLPSRQRTLCLQHQQLLVADQPGWQAIFMENLRINAARITQRSVSCYANRKGPSVDPGNRTVAGPKTGRPLSYRGGLGCTKPGGLKAILATGIQQGIPQVLPGRAFAV